MGAPATCFTVLTVTATVIGDPDGVTVALAKVQLAPGGRLLQLNCTAWLNPLKGVKITL
jgi:hypothetical protein